MKNINETFYTFFPAKSLKSSVCFVHIACINLEQFSSMANSYHIGQCNFRLRYWDPRKDINLTKNLFLFCLWGEIWKPLPQLENLVFDNAFRWSFQSFFYDLYFSYFILKCVILNLHRNEGFLSWKKKNPASLLLYKCWEPFWQY